MQDKECTSEGEIKNLSLSHAVGKSAPRRSSIEVSIRSEDDPAHGKSTGCVAVLAKTVDRVEPSGLRDRVDVSAVSHGGAVNSPIGALGYGACGLIAVAVVLKGVESCQRTAGSNFEDCSGLRRTTAAKRCSIQVAVTSL